MMQKLKTMKFFKLASTDHSSAMAELETLNCNVNTGASEQPNESEVKDIIMDNGEMVDFVLVYDAEDCKTPQRGPFKNEDKETIRAIFENNLRLTGVVLEKEIVNSLTFIKINVPPTVLKTYCELLKMKMPLREEKSVKLYPEEFNVMGSMKTACKKLIRYCVTIDPSKNYHEETTLYAEYSRNKFYLFDEDSPTFFTPSIRILVIDYILNRTRWTENDDDLESVGIQTLIDNDVYKAAYPVHDGSYNEEGCLRNCLRRDWAQLRKWIRLQPIDDVKNYLGVKFGFYFAWLGFYTALLIPASFLGLTVFLYGYFTLREDPISSFICNNGTNFIMCPVCDKNCRYWNISETCFGSKITYLFDNNFSVVFAFLLSVWATFFLELWKRHAAVLSHRWGLSDYTTQWEHPCPEYLAKLAHSKKKKVNMETGLVEPVVSFWFHTLPTVLFSYTVVIFFILVALAAVGSIVIYRMWINNVHTFVDNATGLSKYASAIVPVVAGFLNLASIMILGQVYNKVANYLTTLELPRTQTEFDKSMTIKMYIFQFVNYYASIMYIAFFKGKFVGYPRKYNKILGYRQEECTGGACLTELSIQLAIIMGGQQFYGTILEMVVPAGWNWFNRYSLTKKNDETNGSVKVKRQRWAEDYKLLEWSKQELFSEYLEIAIQYGFVTLFAAAFPLAPLLALINNIFELRLDAQKFLKYYRRPVPYQVPNIGVWYRIFDIIGKLAVIFNAAIIAFSSNFIPLLVHWWDDNPEPFMEFSTSIFHTVDYRNTSTIPSNSVGNITVCRYFGYRDDNSYKHTKVHFKILAMRLLFIFLFQNAVFTLKTAAQWLIPDVPQKLSERMRREARIVTQLMIKREKESAINNMAAVDEDNLYSDKRNQCELFLNRC
ncbi:hypothetical protein V9T40_014430 [Parthenolecanium corni]|uniref:Anoctamin n=1 Tax=Parthenolecanium corni TaxID=536013 RepID=A0AAN9TGC6_9HEMI